MIDRRRDVYEPSPAKKCTALAPCTSTPAIGGATPARTARRASRRSAPSTPRPHAASRARPTERQAGRRRSDRDAARGIGVPERRRRGRAPRPGPGRPLHRAAAWPGRRSTSGGRRARHVDMAVTQLGAAARLGLTGSGARGDDLSSTSRRRAVGLVATIGACRSAEPGEGRGDSATLTPSARSTRVVLVAVRSRCVLGASERAPKRGRLVALVTSAVGAMTVGDAATRRGAAAAGARRQRSATPTRRRGGRARAAARTGAPRKTAWSSSMPGRSMTSTSTAPSGSCAALLGADAARGVLEPLAVPAAVLRRGRGEVAVDLRERALEARRGALELAPAAIAPPTASTSSDDQRR